MYAKQYVMQNRNKIALWPKLLMLLCENTVNHSKVLYIIGIY